MCDDAGIIIHYLFIYLLYNWYGCQELEELTL